MKESTKGKKSGLTKKSTKSTHAASEDEHDGDESETQKSPPTKKKGNKSAQTKKRKKQTPASSEEEISGEESDSQQSPPTKKTRVKPKGKVSHIEIVSASEDEDWSKPRNKFGFLVGHNVPEKIKVKIQSDKFVEMTDLLPSASDHKDDLVLKRSEEGVRFVNSKKRPYMTIDNWNQAFGIYMSAYIEPYTTASASEAILIMKQLLTYQRDINAFARSKDFWYQYDRRFRKDREHSSSPSLFCDIRHDIILDLSMQDRGDRSSYNQDKPNRRSFRYQDRSNNASKGDKRTSTATGPCYLFNDEHKRCTRFKCQYKHSCSKCGARHPRFMCERFKAASDTIQRLQSATPARQTTTTQQSG